MEVAFDIFFILRLVLLGVLLLGYRCFQFQIPYVLLLMAPNYVCNLFVLNCEFTKIFLKRVINKLSVCICVWACVIMCIFICECTWIYVVTFECMGACIYVFMFVCLCLYMYVWVVCFKGKIYKTYMLSTSLYICKDNAL